MKHIKTFENYSTEPEVNEGMFGGDDKEAREKMSKQFDTVNAKLVGTKGDQTKNKDKWLERAKSEDKYNGQFVVDRGVLQYHSKSKNPLQGKTGGSSGFGTANASYKYNEKVNNRTKR